MRNKNGGLNQQVIASCPQAVPSRKTWRRPLMVRQPYSVAVPSTGGRLHPSFQRREGLVRMWSSLWLKGDGGIRKNRTFIAKMYDYGKRQ